MEAEATEPAEPAGVPGDPADMAHSVSARETSYEIGSVESRTVAQIDYMLQRIDSGKYGICEDCGKRIPAARLRAMPFAYLCVECKQRDEQADEMGEAEKRRSSRWVSANSATAIRAKSKADKRPSAAAARAERSADCGVRIAD